MQGTNRVANIGICLLLELKTVIVCLKTKRHPKL